jgi:hypothetical protein
VANPYLISAYAFTALLFGLYAWNIGRRKSRAQREIEALRKNASER